MTNEPQLVGQSASIAAAHYAPTPPAYYELQAPRPSRKGRWLAAIAALVVVLGFGGAFAANAYIKSEICGSLDAVADGSSVTGDDAQAAPPDFAEMREQVDAMRAYGKLLVFDGELKAAVLGLADDGEQIIALVEPIQQGEVEAGPEHLPQLLAVAASLETHVRDAQRACGLPATGLGN